MRSRRAASFQSASGAAVEITKPSEPPVAQPSSDWHRGFSISTYHFLKLLGLCSALLDVLMQGISEFQ
jgi:hypothetical protein